MQQEDTKADRQQSVRVVPGWFQCRVQRDISSCLLRQLDMNSLAPTVNAQLTTDSPLITALWKPARAKNVIALYDMRLIYAPASGL